ncbi:MAG TPA: 50S ribosomal protein L10 [Ktedonobacterales bacterium]|jgi:large subunit ribosomal protein L10|nr:50S ribosomal protein L10 [Ktedonobacterales bacterium]
MPTNAKAAVIEELTDKLKRTRSAVLLQTEGLTVAEISEMRRRLSSSGVEMHVVKNTLLRIASERAEYQDISKILTGQTTLALSYDDEVAPAKAVTDFLKAFKTAKPVTIKAGILERGPISPAQVDVLAKVPPRDQLRSEVVGTFMGPLNQTYGVLSAPLRDLVNVLEARIRQMGEPAAAA